MKKWTIINTILLVYLCLIVSCQRALASEQRWDNPTDEHICLALNIYHEARNQGLAGRVAVALVTLNRMRDSRFPDNICDVVKQGPVRASWKKNGTFYPIRHRCQFSWYCDGKSDKPHQKAAWRAAKATANWFLDNEGHYIFDFTDGSTFYHAHYVKPEWSTRKQRTGRIEDHIFYKWISR